MSKNLEINKNNFLSVNSISSPNIFDLLSTTKQKNISVNSLELIHGTIRSLVGNKVDSLNEYTVSAAAQNFSLFIKKRRAKNGVFVAHDGSLNGILFSKVFASTLISENIETYFNTYNKPLNNAMAIHVAKESGKKFDYIVTFSEQLSKNQHAISFFDKNGFLLPSKHSKEINALISETNFLNLKIPKNEVPTLSETNLFNNYIENLVTDKDVSNVELSITNTFKFNEEILEKFFQLNNLNPTFIKHKKQPTKINEISRKSINQSIFKKKDLILNFTTNINEFEIIVKHKKRWKFLSLNDLALIYIYYIKNFENESIHNKQVYYSYLSSKYINYYCQKYNIKNEEFNVLIDIFNKEKELLLATNGENYLITKKNKSYCSDPLLNMQLVIELASFFKKQNKSLYDVLTNIYLENGIFNFSSIKQQLDPEMATRFFNKLQNLKEIDGKRVIRIKKNQSEPTWFEVILEDKSVILTQYLRNSNTMLINVSTWNFEKVKTKKDTEINFMNLIIKQKEIVNILNSLKENFDVKKVTWSGIVKYSIFIILFAILCYLMFTFVLDGDNGLWKNVKNFLIAESYFAYLIPVFILACLFQMLIGCWLSIRILSKLGEKVKLRHIFIAQFISICISTITPLIYGGESVGYWYLRRKGVKRAPVAAMFLVQSLLAQLNLIIFSFIFVPIGFIRFYSVILGSRGEGIILIILIIVGSIIDIFSAVMISLLTFSFKLQNSIARNLNKFIEWIPFIVTRDANEKGARLKYEFSNINKAAKTLFTQDVWYKNILMFLELIAYRILAKLFDWGILCAIVGNMINNETYEFKGYFDMMAASVLVRSINAINFIIPGGLGVSDWAYKNIMVSLFKYNIANPELSAPGAAIYYNVTVWQALTRIMFTFSLTILSSFALLTVFIGESRIEKYKRIKQTLSEEEIKSGNIRLKSRFYSISILPWMFGIGSLIGGWYLIYNFLIL